MDSKLVTNFLQGKGFTVVTPASDVEVSAYNITSQVILSYIVGPKKLKLCYKDTGDVRFHGKVENLQQINLILKLTSV